MEETDQFCPSCGLPVNAQGQMPPVQGQAPMQGQMPPMQGQMYYQQPPRQPSAGAVQFKTYMGEILAVLLGMFTKPIATVRDAAGNPKKQSSFILAGALALIHAIFALLLVKTLLGSIVSAMSGFMGGYIGSIPASFYVKVFFAVLLSAIFFIGALSGVIYLMGGLVFKGKINFFSAWNLSTAAAVPYAGTALVGTLLSYLSSGLGMIVMFAGSLISLFSVYSGTKEAMDTSDDKTLYTVVLAYLASFLVLYIFIRIFMG
jgi:hypothetical protein